MNKRLLSIPAILLVVGTAGPVVSMAEDSSIDRNQDGYISAAEAEVDASLAEKFAELDVNGDGLLDKEELHNPQPQADDVPQDNN